MARILTVIFSVVFIAGSIGWLATFEVNLHCYQYTSFRIATFDRVPFEEDEGPPLVYRDGFAAPLRIYFAVSILGFFLAPPLAGILAVRRVVTWRQWARITKGSTGLLLFNILLPNIVVGERFWTLGAFSLAIAHRPAGRRRRDPRHTAALPPLLRPAASRRPPTTGRRRQALASDCSLASEADVGIRSSSVARVGAALRIQDVIPRSAAQPGLPR